MIAHVGRRNYSAGIVTIVITGLIYFLAGKFGLSLAFINPSASAIWPPTGISIAAFFIFGAGIWPAIFLGSFFVNISTTGLLAPSIFIAVGNTLEGASAFYFVKKFIRGNDLFSKPSDIFIYTVIAGIICTTVSASFGVSALLVSGMIAWHESLPVWTTWWIGDMGGALIVTPVILLWHLNYKIIWKVRQLMEGITILLLLIFINSFLFFEKLPPYLAIIPLTFISVPVLIWLSIRFSPRETATGVLIVALFSIWGTLNGYGLFAGKDLNHSLLNVQIFLGIIFIAVMPLASAVLQQKKLKEKLHINQEQYRILADTASEAILSINDKNKITFCNTAVQKVFGFSKHELIGKDFTLLMPGHLREQYKKRIENYFSTGIKNRTWENLELPGLHRSGKEILLEISLGEFQEPQKQFTVVIRDITERKIIEENNAFLAAIVEFSNDAIIGKSKEYNIISWNYGAEQMYGYTAEEVIGKHISIIVPEERKHETEIFNKNILKGIRVNQYETERVRKDGTKINISLTVSPIKDSYGKIIGASAIERDITEKINAHIQLNNSLKEKDILMREIHHRVKNNLQIVSSLINLQSHYISDKKSLEVFEESQNRIKTMSLIHEKLYQSKNFLDINLSSYLNDLSSNLVKAYQKNDSDISLFVNIEENNLDIDQMILLGLILNELVTNSIKYAFTEGKGEIKIDFFKQNSKHIFIIKDNGKGLPDNFDFKNTNTLGLSLVSAFVNQLRGDIEYQSRGCGTEFKIIF